MRATHGTAIYTGGGIYNVIGETDNGLWFMGGSDWCSLFDSDVTEEDEYTDMVCYNNDWCEKHEVKVDLQELYEMFEDFCRRLDNKEPGITDGYENHSNYAAGEICDYIDFSEFVDYKPNGSVLVKGRTAEEVFDTLVMNVIKNCLLYDSALKAKVFTKVDELLTKIDNSKEHRGYYITFTDPEEMPLIYEDFGEPKNNSITVWYKITYSNGDFNLYKKETED